MRAGAAVLAGVLVLGAAVSTAGTLKTNDLQAQVTSLDADASAAHAESVEASTALDLALASQERLGADKAAREAVLAERAGFTAAVAEAANVFDAAEGKVDVAGHRDTVLAAQVVVLAESADPAVVKAETEKVAAAAKAAAEQLADWERQEAARTASAAAAAPRNGGGGGSGGSGRPSGDGGGGGGDWFSQMHGYLNNAGGSWVTLNLDDGRCARIGVVACASADGIYINEGIASWSPARKAWAMTHELAHMYQCGVWDQIMASSTYQSSFGSNIELLANCMA